MQLWNAEIHPDIIFEIDTKQHLYPTTATMVSNTQCTASFKIENIYPEYSIKCNGNPIKGNSFVIDNLFPGQQYQVNMTMSLDDCSYTKTISYQTKEIVLKPQVKSDATNIDIIGAYEGGDAQVIKQRIEVNSQHKIEEEGTKGIEMSICGLEPNTDHRVTYTVTVSGGQDGMEKMDFSTNITTKTGELKFKTLPPKVISPGEVIVAAESNITNDEEKVGFEWRRTDAPEEVPSRSGEAYLFQGTMEGYIHNLTSFNYWRFRPYYQSAAGNKYYGEWGIVEADDYSYFEPTVHTYAKINVEGDSVEVSGYAMRGTDEVEEQGFAYWEDGEGNEVRAFGSVLPHQVITIPAKAKTVAATGQVMSASITGLAYERTYRYVAYMKTSTGKTYYGEEQAFTTGEAPVGVAVPSDCEENTIVARYDLNGRRIAKPVRGVNILRMSDGTTRKVVVK